MGTRLKVMKLETLLYLNENYIPDPDRGFLSHECSVVCITFLRVRHTKRPGVAVCCASVRRRTVAPAKHARSVMIIDQTMITYLFNKNLRTLAE